MTIKDIAEYEESDSELAKKTITRLRSEKEEATKKIDTALEYIQSTFVTDNPIEFKNTLYEILKGIDNKESISYKRLLEIAKKLHTWVFTHTADEMCVYNELGLTKAENELLGYVCRMEIEVKDESE